MQTKLSETIFSRLCVCGFFIICLFNLLVFIHLAVKVLVWRVCDSRIFLFIIYWGIERVQEGLCFPDFVFLYNFFLFLFLLVDSEIHCIWFWIIHWTSVKRLFTIALESYITFNLLPITGLHNEVCVSLLWFQLYIHLLLSHLINDYLTLF